MKALKQTVRTISLDQIENILKNMQISHIIDTIQEGFVAYSSGSVVVPPVGEMLFEIAELGSHADVQPEDR
ncbi:MAG: hypothetical protein JRI64_05440 [Deltaproteobacteria bacterium]|nr:hypothetical protein [Deltaproteobacteria bacterium]